MAGLLQSGVLEERVNGSETCIAGARTVATLLLQMIEEAADEGRVDLRKLEC